MPNKLTPEELAAIQARCDAAKGPWRVSEQDIFIGRDEIAVKVLFHDFGDDFAGDTGGYPLGDIAYIISRYPGTAPLIVNAPTDIPALLAHIAAQDAELEAAREAGASLAKSIHTLTEILDDRTGEFETPNGRCFVSDMLRFAKERLAKWESALAEGGSDGNS